MYGRRCIGISGSHSELMSLIARVIQDLAVDIRDGTLPESVFNDYVDTLLSFKQDSMGYDVIYYWTEFQTSLVSD